MPAELITYQRNVLDDIIVILHPIILTCTILFNPYEISAIHEGVYTLGIRLTQKWGELLKN